MSMSLSLSDPLSPVSAYLSLEASYELFVALVVGDSAGVQPIRPAVGCPDSYVTSGTTVGQLAGESVEFRQATR